MAQAAAGSRRQMIEDARAAALAGRWEEAISLNQRIIERAQRDAEAHNRLGRAYLALGQLQEATEAYSDALRADPANLIARRNLQRLETLRHRSADGTETPRQVSAEDEGVEVPRTSVFIEEVGKTWVDELVNPAAKEILAEIFPAEQLELAIEDSRLIVATTDGTRLGEIEAKSAERIVQLINSGNRYEVYALGLTAQSLRVILREVYRDPSLADKVSFPRQITSRAYLRERDLLRQRDEADFFLLDEEEEEETITAEVDEEESTESEGETFIDETGPAAEEDESAI